MCRLNIVAGRRQIALDAYLRPAMPRGNLRVVAGALAHRLLMDRQRCVGVEYSVSGGLYRAAAGEIVLTAGVIGTPKLLMLSGIGPASALAPHGIEVVAELPGVGENLHDHPAAYVTYRPARPVPAAPAPGLRLHPLLLRRAACRLETEIALTELARRLENPRLLADPPPYGPNPLLHGPRHLPVEFDRIRPAHESGTLNGIAAIGTVA
jgi:hypothetical protein